MARISQILETALYVQDIAMAERFYTEVLGLHVYSKSGNRHVFFKIGQSMLLLFNAEACQKPGGVPCHGAEGPGHVAFAVQHGELDFWRAKLKDHNVAVEQEITWPSGGHSIYFRDLDGNSLELATPDTWP